MKKNIFAPNAVQSTCAKEETAVSSKNSWWQCFKKKHFTGDKIGNFFARLIVVVSSVFAGAMLWEAIGDIAPSLRELCPHFFTITDMVVGWWDAICSFICKLLGLA